MASHLAAGSGSELEVGLMIFHPFERLPVLSRSASKEWMAQPEKQTPRPGPGSIPAPEHCALLGIHYALQNAVKTLLQPKLPFRFPPSAGGESALAATAAEDAHSLSLLAAEEGEGTSNRN